jgi:hypothetical protein
LVCIMIAQLYLTLKNYQLSTINSQLFLNQL